LSFAAEANDEAARIRRHFHLAAALQPCITSACPQCACPQHHIGTTGLRQASVVLAIVIALVAVALASKLRDEDRLSWRKFLAAAVLGLVVPIMHYTAMAAVNYAPSPMHGGLDFSIRRLRLE